MTSLYLLKIVLTGIGAVTLTILLVYFITLILKNTIPRVFFRPAVRRFHIEQDKYWAHFNFVFSDACHKRSSYKFGFIKAIIDCLYSMELTQLYQMIFWIHYYLNGLKRGNA